MQGAAICARDHSCRACEQRFGCLVCICGQGHVRFERKLLADPFDLVNQMGRFVCAVAGEECPAFCRNWQADVREEIDALTGTFRQFSRDAVLRARGTRGAKALTVLWLSPVSTARRNARWSGATCAKSPCRRTSLPDCGSPLLGAGKGVPSMAGCIPIMRDSSQPNTAMPPSGLDCSRSALAKLR